MKYKEVSHTFIIKSLQLVEQTYYCNNVDIQLI